MTNKTRGNYYAGVKGRNREKVHALYRPNAKNPLAERDNTVEGSREGEIVSVRHGNDNKNVWAHP